MPASGAPFLVGSTPLPVLLLVSVTCYPLRAMYDFFPGYSDGRPVPADRLSRSSAQKCPAPSGGLCPELHPFSFRFPSNELPPFAQRQGFWRLTPPADQAAGRPGFLLQTVTSFLRPGLRHYYGVICHLAPLRSTLSFLLSLPIRRLRGRYKASPVTSDSPCATPPSLTPRV